MDKLLSVRPNSSDSTEPSIETDVDEEEAKPGNGPMCDPAEEVASSGDEAPRGPPKQTTASRYSLRPRHPANQA